MRKFELCSHFDSNCDQFVLLSCLFEMQMLLLLLWIVNPAVFFYTKALYFPLVCATLLLMTAACFYFIACWSALQAAAFMWQHIFCILFWIPIYIGNGISLWSGRCYILHFVSLLWIRQCIAGRDVSIWSSVAVGVALGFIASGTHLKPSLLTQRSFKLFSRTEVFISCLAWFCLLFSRS